MKNRSAVPGVSALLISSCSYDKMTKNCTKDNSNRLFKMWDRGITVWETQKEDNYKTVHLKVCKGALEMRGRVENVFKYRKRQEGFRGFRLFWCLSPVFFCFVSLFLFASSLTSFVKAFARYNQSFTHIGLRRQFQKKSWELAKDIKKGIFSNVLEKKENEPRHKQQRRQSVLKTCQDILIIYRDSGGKSTLCWPWLRSSVRWRRPECLRKSHSCQCEDCELECWHGWRWHRVSSCTISSGKVYHRVWFGSKVSWLWNERKCVWKFFVRASEWDTVSWRIWAERNHFLSLHPGSLSKIVEGRF